MSTILVTGGSGFVGSHVVAACLRSGHTVRTTVRDLKRMQDVLQMLNVAGVDPGGHLSFFAADLGKDDGWKEAIAGCDFVLHVASPFPSDKTEHEDEIIKPAKEGALRVLREARDSGVKRVVMTSSFAAIGYGYPEKDRTFDEADWTNVESKIEPYIKSKALAEKAAWDFIKAKGANLELTTLNPTGIFGPSLGRDFSASFAIIQALTSGAMPFCPKIYFGIVDVRDVAELHLAAMMLPEAAGQRFLITNGPTYSMRDVALILKKGLGANAGKVPTFEAPSWALRVLALLVPKMQGLLPNLDIIRRGKNEKARHLLKWTPRSAEDAIISSAESMARFSVK